MIKNLPVYWTTVGHTPSGVQPYYLNIDAPDNMMTELKALSKTLGDSTNQISFLKCPSIINTTKNCFVIRSPIDFVITYDGRGVSTNLQDHSILQVRNGSAGFLSLRFISHLFFTEYNSLNMRIRNAYYSVNNFTENCSILEGEFDVGKWFRSIDCALFFKKPATVNVRQGDALFYVEFESKDQVSLHKFIANNEILTLHQYCLSAKNYNKFPLANYFNMLYSMFAKSNLKNRIIQQIKSSLV